MLFSQRIGKTPETKKIQIEEMDSELRNGLWNCAKIFFIDTIEKSSDLRGKNHYNNFSLRLWVFLYKKPVDERPFYTGDTTAYIREKFFSSPWFDVYNFLEFIALDPWFKSTNYIEFCNKILEKENSWYRFIGNIISPITNTEEMAEIEQAIDISHKFSWLNWANEHLTNALQKISDKENPDYRNSIKESISAVESVVKKISGNDKDSLSSALDKIKGKIKIHTSLEQGFKKIYWYTSDDSGIRHALTEEPTCDFEDAKFMLVSCSAFINYLIGKANKTWIKLN